MRGHSRVLNDFWDYHAQHLPTAACGLYCYLVRLENEEGRAWPTIKAMEAKLNISRNHVRHCLRALEERGLIVVETSPDHKGGHSYLIQKEIPIPDQIGSRSTPISEKRVTEYPNYGSEKGSRSTPITGKGVPGDIKKGYLVTSNGVPGTPNSYLSTQTNKTQIQSSYLLGWLSNVFFHSVKKCGTFHQRAIAVVPQFTFQPYW